MKVGVLLVAYGSANFRGNATLRSVQAAAEKRFQKPVRWAFTSETMRQRLATSRTKSDSVYKALLRMSYERYTHIAVQSLHIIPGSEYDAVANDCHLAAENTNLQIRLGHPLLSPESVHDERSSIAEVARLLALHVPAARSSEDPVVYMAHGSRNPNGLLYRILDNALKKIDQKLNVVSMIPCVQNEDEQSGISEGDELHSLLPRLSSLANGHSVWLLPLLSLVGRHTLDDMAGISEHSWKNRILSAGIACRTELRSLADDPAFVSLWLDRLEKALHELVQTEIGASFKSRFLSAVKTS